MGADPLILTLWIFLLSGAASGGVINQFDVFQNQDEPTCSTEYKDELLHIDCSNRGLTEIPLGIDENVRKILILRLDQEELSNCVEPWPYLYDERPSTFLAHSISNLTNSCSSYYLFQVNILDLSNNNFATFPSDIGNLTSLQILDLSENYLSSGYLPAFLENLKDLETLNLSRNNYNTWIGDGRYYRIKILDLSENKIKDVDFSAVSEVPHLIHLDLSENRINELIPTIFASAFNLETLILSRNFFSEVPSFQSQSLKSLYLDNCQISNLEVGTFLGMPSLLKVDLSANLIEEIPDNLSSDSLKELDLSYNVISSLSDRSFSSLPYLEVLDLRGNEFREIWSTSYFVSNLFLREIHVKGNRWTCDGFSVNLLCTYEFLTKHPPKVSDVVSLMCYSPQNVSQMTWLEAYNQTWHSGERISAKMAIMIGVIIGIVLTSFVCRGLMALNKPDPPRPVASATSLNLNGDVPQARAETVVLRIPLQEDLPPTYDEALLMPRLNASFHSLPDFVDEEEEDRRRYRRSRSIGDLTESRIRAGDRRSVRRAVEIHIN